MSEILSVYLTLMILLGATFGIAYVDLGRFNAVISLLIAAIKGSLVALFFMRLRWNPGLQRLFSLAGVIWLAILITLCLSDALSRNWLALPGHWP